MKTPTAAEASVRRCQTLIYLYFLVCARCEGLFEVWVQQWVSAATGETAILPCNYTCNQNSEHFEFHWLRILNSSKEKIFSKNSKGEVTFLERAHWLGTTDLCNASIAIRDVRPSDSGSYLCQVLLLPSFNEGQTSLILEVVATRDEGREAAWPQMTAQLSGLWCHNDGAALPSQGAARLPPLHCPPSPPPPKHAPAPT
ncbi:uncharacterized protein LOC133359978 isoform X3 [Lethenteron reissneri]|uniref:uncharacterized protein LOC133359978 isoform X3 n=1 Tax=Lethenteron reissneri TaxID=7753 RepID=UPI002AB7753B|nr:uncharacterized protein LOC133359978 isoform X3 [Lethenteron reissneri]